MSAEVATRKSVDETIEEILSRYTVRDLVEQTDAQLDIADQKYATFSDELTVVGRGQENMINFWRVDSKGKIYEARRFENFVWCSCKDFFFKRQMCKHLALTIKHYCKRCRAALAREDGLCWGCHTDCFPYGKTAAQNQETKNA
jgi:hypothetical protein